MIHSNQKANALLALHGHGELLVLPNVWNYCCPFWTLSGSSIDSSAGIEFVGAGGRET